jgi:hypothetical protein
MQAQKCRAITHLSAIGAAVCLAAAAASPVFAQQKSGDATKQIVGMWKLESVTNTKDGVTKAGSSFGPTPAGRLVFSPSGNYVSFNTNPNLPKIASGNRASGKQSYRPGQHRRHGNVYGQSRRKDAYNETGKRLVPQ